MWKPAACVVLTGYPDETYPEIRLIPFAQPVDVEKSFNLLVRQGLPFLLNLRSTGSKSCTYTNPFIAIN